MTVQATRTTEIRDVFENLAEKLEETIWKTLA